MKNFPSVNSIGFTVVSLLLAFATIPAGHASNTTICTASSNPVGVLVGGVDVWVGLSSGSLGESGTSSCSVSTVSVSGTPHLLAMASNNQLAYTDHSSTGCVYTYNTVTANLVKQWCQASSNPDDIAVDPTNTNIVWVGLYGANSILKLNLGSSSSSYSLPNSCTEPEGLRVDTSGNVWVASQGCNKIFKYVPSTSTWSSCSMNTLPWYLSLDNTNNQVWVAAHNLGSSGNVFDIAMSSCNSATTGLPSGDTGPIGIDVYGHKVGVTFHGTVDVYNFALLSWACGPDSYGTAGPYGISHDSSGNYWVALNGGSEIAEGFC